MEKQCDGVHPAVITPVGLVLGGGARGLKILIPLFESVEASLSVFNIVLARFTERLAHLFVKRRAGHEVVNSAAHLCLARVRLSCRAVTNRAANNIVEEVAALAAEVGVTKNVVLLLPTPASPPNLARTCSNAARKQELVLGIQPFPTGLRG